MISVIMCTYKEPIDYIHESVKSIIRQSYNDLELVIVVDCPERKDIIDYIRRESRQDRRIRLIINKKNLGLAKSLNKAIKNSRGEFIARMDADDISVMDRLECQLNLLQNENIDLVGCNVLDMDRAGMVFDKKGTHLPTDDAIIKKYLMIDSAVLHPTWLARRDVFSQGYSDFPACEDYELLTRLSINGKKFGNLKEPKLWYRIDGEGISSTKRITQKIGKYYIRDKYKKGEYCILDELNNYLKSSQSASEKKSLEKYYKHVNSIKQLNGNKIAIFIRCLWLLIVSKEAKRVATDKLKKKILRIRFINAF